MINETFKNVKFVLEKIAEIIEIHNFVSIVKILIQNF